jgi:hypothetical protein
MARPWTLVNAVRAIIDEQADVMSGKKGDFANGGEADAGEEAVSYDLAAVTRFGGEFGLAF